MDNIINNDKTNNLLCPNISTISLKRLMPLLLDMSYEEIQNGQIKPSLIVRELKLTTEERFEKMRHPLRKYRIGNKLDTFSRNPEAIIYQNFKKGVSYTTTLYITNQLTVPQNLTVSYKRARHFTISYPKEGNRTKVAPGMSYVLNVTFLPTERMRDYMHEIRFCTNDRGFVVPIFGFRPKPIIHIPDYLVLPSTLVRVPTEKSLLLNNSGELPTSFVTIIEKPFSTDIPKAIIQPQGFLEMKIACKPTKAGKMIGHMKTLCYDQIFVTTVFECEVKNASVILETNYLTFEDVFMGLSAQKTLVLRNHSDYTLTFAWKMYDTEEEKLQVLKTLELMSDIEDYEKLRYEKLEYMDVIDKDGHSKIYDRIYQDEKEEIMLKEDEQFLFENEHFKIIPKVGKILPQSIFEFQVIFFSVTNVTPECLAYLDIVGIDKRLRLTMKGYGIGPKVALNLKSLHTNHIYLTDKHQYEIVVKNSGIIPATLNYKPKKTDFGGVIKCIPSSLQIAPDSSKAFVILFYSEVQGKFLETLDFEIVESKEKLQCILTGDVICPLLKCIPEVLEFGNVSVGLTHERDLTLYNNSQVPIDFEIESNPSNDELMGVKFLQIVPDYGTVAPHKGLKVKVSLSSDVVKDMRTNILLIMWKSRKHTKEIPLHCICACPLVKCTPNNILIKFCFLNCKYRRSIKITNDSDLPGYLEYVPEEVSDTIQCTFLGKTKIFLKAYETIEIGLQIMVTALGSQEMPLNFAVMGRSKETLCTILCNGQGPVISYHPDEVHFGKIEVLKKVEKTLNIVNDSPIPARVKVYCKSTKTFDIEESVLELASEESKEITISAVFNNPGKAKDIILVEILHGDTLSIKVLGEGVGTSILCEPSVSPRLDLGKILTYNDFSLVVKCTNKGIAYHKILCSKQKTVKNLKDEEENEMPYVFNIEPRYFELESNQEQLITIKGMSKKPKDVEEEYFIHALTGKSAKPETIIAFVIAAEFVDPRLSFSKSDLHFNLNVMGLETSGVLEDNLFLRNRTGVGLRVLVTIEDNFSIVSGNGEKMRKMSQNVNSEGEITTNIEFCPTILKKRRYKESGRLIFEYENHPKIDIINLHGEVMFPTIKQYPSKLDFFCVPLGSTSYRTIIIHNISALVVSFKWTWLESSFEIKKLEPAQKNSKTNEITTRTLPNEKEFLDYIEPLNIQEVTEDNPSTQSEQFLVSDTLAYDNNKYIDEMKKLLFSILQPSRGTDLEQMLITPLQNSVKNDFLNWFSLEPSEGILEPNEYTTITVGFSPPHYVEITATAVCKIYGGEEEPLLLTGKCSKLSYMLNNSSINYGSQVFCEICTKEIILTNDGLCSFNFLVTSEEMCAGSLEPESLDVSPKSGTVSPDQSVTFKISYFPGLPGEFMKHIVLEIGYLDPITIKVHGFAVISQVYLEVPRPYMEVNIDDMYKAISWITPEYLESIQTNSIIEEDEIPTGPTDFLKNNDWTWVSYNELYPSIMDIDLAIERILAFNHVSKNRKILKDHTFLKKVSCIPQLYSPPYCIDFGYVTRDIPVCYTVLIYNYGPIRADVKLVDEKDPALQENELRLEFANKVFAPGETIELYVVFSPTRKRFPDLNAKIDIAFCLSVRHGPIITVKVTAEVTLPTVSLGHTSLDFEKVYCGDAFRKSVIVTNNGNVSSKWFASINKPTKKGAEVGFYMFPTQGELEPEKKAYLYIYFIPSRTGIVKRTLTITVEGNENFFIVELLGEGIQANLMVVPNDLKFLPTLAYFDSTMYFRIQNLAEIPVEFYFPQFDTDAEYEKRLIEIYLKHKNLKNIYIPYREAGQKLPEFLTVAYINMLERLRNKMITSSTEPPDELDLIENISPSKTIIKSIEDPLAKYSTKELDSLLMEFIDAEGFDNDETAKETTYELENYSGKIEIIEPEMKIITDPTERNAVLMIFHGAPTTDYYKAANDAGIALSFPVYSIDRLIIESLVESLHSCAEDIINKINEKFYEFVSDSVISLLDKEDIEYDKILDRIEVILTGKPKKLTKKESAKEKSSKASSEKSQSKNKRNTDCFLNIPPDSIIDLLRPKLKKINYLIVECLNSIFLPKENLALYTLLRAAGQIQYIHLVVLTFTLADYIRNEEEKLLEINKGTSEKVSGKSKAPEKSEKPSKKGSEKKSELSHKSKGTEVNKKILQALNKNLKSDLEKFEQLQNEMLHISEFWDRKTTSLKKPYNEKGTVAQRKDGSNKDSSKTVKSSVRKPSITNLEDTVSCQETGLHIWLVLNSARDRSIDFSSMIKSCITQFADLQEVKTYIQQSAEEKFEESETVFSVLSKPINRKNCQSAVFCIRDFQDEKIKGSSESVSIRSRSKSSEIKPKRRRGSKRRFSTESRHSDASSLLHLKEENEQKFTTKLVLSPGEMMSYQVTFLPSKCGKYKQVYTLETTGQSIPYQIKCNAVCEIPKLDFIPEIMFPRTLTNYKEKASYDHFVYIKDQNIFDFGSVIVSINLDKCQIYSCDLVLRNSSQSTCEVTASLNDTYFFCEPNDLMIPPKCEDRLKVGIKPTKIGTITSTLYLSVKNNPKVEQIILACTPCKLEFSITPKSISFDKIPIDYSAKRILKMTNSSPINLRWEFVDYGWVTEVFDISEVRGYVGLYSVCEVVFRFKPKEEESLPKKHLQIKVFDVNSANDDPYFTETISIHAESVEYSLELDELIDYGEIKGGLDHKYNLAVTNKGKCEVAVKIQTLSNPLEQENFVREFFKIQPQFFTLTAQKTENVAINFYPTSPFSVKNCTVVLVNIMENVQSQKIFKFYEVKISATVFMPRYKLCPNSKMNFGHVQLLGSKKMTLQLTNTGRFPFSFSIANLAKLLEAMQKGTTKKDKKEKGTQKGDKKTETEKASNKSMGSKKEKKSAKSDEKETKTKSEKSKTSKGTKSIKVKGDKKALKITKLELDGFTLIPSSGIIEPNETFMVSVDFNPRESKTYKEEILLDIAEIKDIKHKKTIVLDGSGCEPKVNLKDFNSVFVEPFVANTMEEFIEPQNIEKYCLFVVSEVALYFKLVCVNTTKTVRVYFKNTGYITANLTTRVDDLGKGVFNITPANQVVEPYNVGLFEVAFKPNTLEEVRGTLDISYNASTDNKLSVLLVGKACLPQIRLVTPVPENKEAVISFPSTCVGYQKKEKIAFENIGLIQCKIILAISDDHNKVFEIVPVDSTINFLNVQDLEHVDDMKRNIMINLLPCQLAEFLIYYKPIKEQSLQVALNLHTLYNPFEDNKITIHADSYNCDIIFEGLEAFRIDLSNLYLIPNSSIGYILDFGFTELYKLNKKSFFIRNISEGHIYKFRFYCTSVMFIPEVGHLKPHACKEILVIFKASAPIVIQKEEINCNICKIQYVSPNMDALSWDDRQKCVFWTTESNFSSSSLDGAFSTIYNNAAGFEDKYTSSNTGTHKSSDDGSPEMKGKLIMEGTEPEIVTLSDTSENIPVFLTVVANYSNYVCDTKVINLSDTFLKETSSVSFVVENDGNVSLRLEWNIKPRNNNVFLKRSNSTSNVTDKDSEERLSFKSCSFSSLLSSDNWSIEDDLPININPNNTIIEPGQNKTFSVIFSPEKAGVYEFSLRSVIYGLDPIRDEIDININGKALSIPFYIELEGGVILSKNAVLDFESVGTGSECTRSIYLINPSDDPFSFQVSSQDNKEFSYFICESPKGKIKEKKKAQIVFCFTPQIFGTFKQLYNVKIIEKNITEKLLLQGKCREPKVYFTEPTVTIKPTVSIVKSVKAIKLVNEESFTVPFKIIKKSTFDENQLEKLEVFPMSGKLKPMSQTDLRLTFVTQKIGCYNFHLKCMVEKLRAPLNLYVSASCLEIKSSVTYFDKEGKPISLQENRLNVVDFGHTIKGRKEVMKFKISNNGQTGMFYSWDYDSKPIAYLFSVCIDNEKGFLKSGCQTESNLCLETIRLGALKKFKINLQIMYGPTYALQVHAISDKPIYSFSFNNYNFGYCFIQKNKSKQYKTVLSFKNLDSKPILLENVFDETDYLSLDFWSNNVPPGESRNISIYFHPQKVASYKTNLHFMLNGVTHTIPITGDGVSIKLEPVNPKNKFIDFQQVVLGSSKKYRVNVFNNTLAQMDVHFDLFDNLIIHRKKIEKIDNEEMKIPFIPPPPVKETKTKGGEKPKKDKGETKHEKVNKAEKKKQKEEQPQEELKQTEELNIQQELERKEYLKCFSITPNVFIQIPPNGKSYFEITFQPNKRMNFNEKIYFETENHSNAFCIIKGSCVAPEFTLDRPTLLFSEVIVGFNSTLIVTLKNTGDTNGSFNWVIDDRRNIFEIEPKQGFVSPKNDFKMRITFSPKQEKCEFKVKAKCVIKEIDEPLVLFLKGNSVRMPDPKETLVFDCVVREQVVKSVSVTNMCSEAWKIRPIVSNEVFSTANEIVAMPQSETQINIKYSPKMMTSAQPDKGTIFIKFPNGNGILYNLIGNSSPPMAFKRIEKEINCKKNYYETLIIQNWLNMKQSLDVITEVTSPMTTKTLYKISGFKTIQLDGMECKKYRWGVYVVNEIPMDFKVTFKNPETGEYLFYEVSLKVLPCVSIGTIHFCTRVRKLMTKQLTLENSIDVPIAYALDCLERSITFEKLIKMNPYTATKVDVTYNPLQTEDLSTTLNVKCEELGTSTYTLALHADPPEPENDVTVKAELGEKTSKMILFKNEFSQLLEFSFKFKNDDFTMERCNPIQPGETGKIVINFEPSAIGQHKGELHLYSSISGEYMYQLIGEGLTPTPKGPYSIKSGFSTIIEFKNSFNEERRFIYEISPAETFYTDHCDEVLQARKSTKIPINIKLLKEYGLSYPVTGKLTVYPENEPDIKWGYYLQHNKQ